MPQSYLPSRWSVPGADISNDPDIVPILPGREFLASKRPQWSSGFAQAASGRERATMIWSYPIWHFTVAYEVLRDRPTLAELQKLYAFFNAHAGRYQQFFFYDETDNAVANQAFGTGDGATTTFQLSRSVGAAPIAFNEPVRGVFGSPSVYVSGGLTTAYTVGPLGQITFNSAPSAGAVLTWSGQFMFLCRFDNDDMDTVQMMQGLWSQAGIQMTTVKA